MDAQLDKFEPSKEWTALPDSVVLSLNTSAELHASPNPACSAHCLIRLQSRPQQRAQSSPPLSWFPFPSCLFYSIAFISFVISMLTHVYFFHQIGTHLRAGIILNRGLKKHFSWRTAHFIVIQAKEACIYVNATVHGQIGQLLTAVNVPGSSAYLGIGNTSAVLLWCVRKYSVWLCALGYIWTAVRANISYFCNSIFCESVLGHFVYILGVKHWLSLLVTKKVLESQEEVCLPAPSLRQVL